MGGGAPAGARIGNVKEEAPWRDLHLVVADDTLSELDAPIFHGKDVIGVINLESVRENAFSEEDEDFLVTLAGQAAIAIKNAQQYEELQRSKAWLAAYSEIDKAIIESVRIGRTLDDVLQFILEKGIDITGSPCGDFMWYDNLSGDLVMRAQRGVPPERLGARQRIGEGIVGLAAANKSTVLVADNQLPAWSQIYVTFIPDMRSELAVPVLDGDQLVGVLNVEHSEPNAYDSESQHRLETLAQLAVLAIQNVTRYEQLQRRIADIQTLHRIGQKITATLDLDEVLRLVMDSAVHLTRADVGELRLVDEDTRELVVRASHTPEGSGSGRNMEAYTARRRYHRLVC